MIGQFKLRNDWILLEVDVMTLYSSPATNGDDQGILDGDSTGLKVVVPSCRAEVLQVMTSRTGAVEYSSIIMSLCGTVMTKEFPRRWIQGGSVTRVLSSTTPVSITANIFLNSLHVCSVLNTLRDW